MSLTDIRIEECEFSARVVHCLEDEPYRTLADLAAATDAELLAIANFGRRSVDEIRHTIAERNDQLPDVPGGAGGPDASDETIRPMAASPTAIRGRESTTS